MKIKVRFAVTHETRNENIDIENDLGISVDEWLSMSEDEKSEKLNEYASEIPEAPSWVVESYKLD